jgi:chemotaxis protein MotB
VNKDGEKQEIVIIRRGGHGHEEGHHGGMWKIAYADFMTAMMALFLVLWLVNSTDEKTQAQIASYFNPIELSDKTTNERGVQDKNQAGSGTEGTSDPKQSGNTKDNTAPRNSLGRSGNSETSDEELFSDPYDVLAKIAAKAAKLPSREGAGGAANSGGAENSGDAFRDPFDPDFRFNAEQPDAGQVDLSTPRTAEATGEGKATGAKSESQDQSATPFADKLAKQVEKAAKLSERAEQELNESGEAKEIRRELMRDIAQAGLAKLPDVSVKQTSEGILISMTDKADFEMFSLSSAEPKPELVVLMEQLAGILAKEPGKIVVRGHTDARPFRSKTYDNWRLSTARAHIAQYMLLRGGLPKERIERIEGYADRALKVPNDPNAAQNRRIEILIKPETT